MGNFKEKERHELHQGFQNFPKVVDWRNRLKEDDGDIDALEGLDSFFKDAELVR